MTESAVNDIYLVMIVRDESHVISATLRNIAECIPLSGFLICDNGSTDDTTSVVTRTMDDLAIEGSVLSHTWYDFATNRNMLLAEAKKRFPRIGKNGSSSFVLMFDADDSIETYASPSSSRRDAMMSVIPFPLTADAYSLQFKRVDFSYGRPLLIKLSSAWAYEGVVHECLCDISPGRTNTTVPIIGPYTVVSGRSGSRSLDRDKYLKDAKALESALGDERTPRHLLPRYAFYCAQSWADHGDTDKAIVWYTRVVDQYENWSEEKYYSCMRLAELHRLKGQTEKGAFYLMTAPCFNAERLECATRLAKLFMSRHRFQSAYNVLSPVAASILTLDDAKPEWLFASPVTYSHDAILQLALASYYTRNYDTMTSAVVSAYERYAAPSVTFNREFCDALFAGSPFYFRSLTTLSSVEGYYALFSSIKQLLVRYCTEVSANDAHIGRTAFDLEFTSMMRDLTYGGEDSVAIQNRVEWLTTSIRSSSREATGVVLTMTTCKRLDEFLMTVKSILHCFTKEDLAMIDRWIVVDDGSTDEDILRMQGAFPFADFIRNTDGDDERRRNGHRDSMNLIHRIITTGDYKYWAHIEDDWLFMKQGSYIESAICFIETQEATDAGVQQVLFNRGYGETVGDVVVPCGETVINGNTQFLLHTRVENVDEYELNIPNSNYWNHFSLRPGVTKVSSVKELGNFDTPNNFFERDYAHRFAEAGFRTGYFNDITCLHMGKLCGQRGDDGTQSHLCNAYGLNSRQQF